MSSIYSPLLKCGVCADLSILHSHWKQCGNLCENCSGLHSKGNAFKNHNVVPLTFSDGMETSSIKVEPSTQLDNLDSTPTAKCTTTAATNAPKPAYSPSSSSNAPTRDYASSTSTNAPTSHNVPPTSTNAPTSHNVPSTPSNAPSTPKKKGVKRKPASVSMKGMKKVACPKHKSNTVNLCCQDCNQAICSQCLTAAHTGHRIGDITDFFGKKRAMIESDLDLIQSHIQQREKAKQQMVEDLEKMEQASESVVKEVKDFADKVRSTILKKAEDLKASTKETKKNIVSRNGEFVKEIKKLETLRKKCQDELNAKDLAVVLFRKESAFSLDTYENLPSSLKITPAAFFPAELDQDMKTFGTIVSTNIQEKPITFGPPSTPIKMPGKKKKLTAQSSTSLPAPTATSASAQDHEILRDAVSKIGKELGMNIVQQ
ncbi:tripartite motif-containing protein 2-like [Saccostrea cucullata]|uniref:tripartite motif-containing protein 2-like n=1 Tax=Saccostrea cuccullata TaxID=36930 RepID=UPI002ED2BAA2